MGNSVAVEERQADKRIEVPDAPQRRARPPVKKGMKPRTKTILALVALVVLGALVLSGVSWSKRGVVGGQTGKVMRPDLMSIVTASGQIKPPDVNLVSVNANTFGKITQLTVKEGDTVKKGQLLLRTEDI